ncbi:MAG: type II secretion system minor pseudopilin GspH [Gammaproteobacteria bacterium]
MTRRLDQRGFTLIEIMVVVVLIGIAVTTIVVKFDFNLGPKEVREEVRRFERLFQMAWEQAQIEGRSVGIEIDQSSFSFYSYDPLQRQWVGMENDEFFKTRELPDGIYFDLRMEDKDIELQTNDDDDTDIDISPQVLLLSSGEATPFNLYVESDTSDIAYELVVDVLGDSELIEHDRGF